MNLVSFAVRKFRSITGTSKLAFRSGVTTLIGPNNEGKSNVLRALVTALEVASRLQEFTVARGGRLRSSGYTDRYYRWDVDFPLALQSGEPDGRTEFDLEFQLTPSEIDDFRTEVKSQLNGTLPIRIGMGTSEPTFSVRKRGPGARSLSEKASMIARFIGKRIELQYIPAVRPASAATDVVERIVSRELAALVENQEYQLAVSRIEELQRPVLEKISASIRDTLQVFLPDVRDVQVHVPREARYRALSRSCEVIVDDGTPTPLIRKGDGVQSLAALGLMRHAAQAGVTGKSLVLAIEEPESHLHPSAIHQLRGVLAEVAAQHQIIVTTHCPLFIDRHDVGSNILVANNRAEPARTVKQIRETMGIRVSDNLVAAEVLLLVEGEDDRRAMNALLAHHSQKLKRAIANGLLAIDTLVGGGNLSYKLTLARDAMCITHALMDNDTSGKEAVKKAVDQGILSLADLTYASCLGMQQSELEDWFDSSLIAPALNVGFGVPAASPHYTSTSKKWSDRMQNLFVSSGKPWDHGVELQVKWKVAETVAASPDRALLPARRTAFDALVASLEAKLASSLDGPRNAHRVSN